MTDYCRDRLGVSSADTARVAQIRRALNQALLRLAVQEGLEESEAPLTYNQDDPIVALPDDLGRIRVIRRAGSGAPLQRVTRQELAVRRAGRTSADGTVTSLPPSAYVLEAADRIRVDPAPPEDDNAGAYVEYVVRPDELTNDSDVPTILPGEYHDLLCELALVRIATSEEKLDLAAQSQALASELLRDLRTYLNARAGDLPVQQPIVGLR